MRERRREGQNVRKERLDDWDLEDVWKERERKGGVGTWWWSKTDREGVKTESEIEKRRKKKTV